MKKRVISVILVVLMVFGMLPITALADSGSKNEHSHKWKGGIITYDNRIIVKTGDSSMGKIYQSEDDSKFKDGDTWHFEAQPEPGYRFVGWTFDNAYLVNSLSDANNANLSFSYKYHIDFAFGSRFTARANFDYANYYSLATNVSGNGSISKNPDKSSYHQDEQVTLTANPDAGWRFVEWQGDASGTSNSVTVTMNGEKSVTAKFEPLPAYLLNINIVGGGSVSKDPDVADYWQGRNVTLTANPASGWRFGSWSGSASGTSNSVSMSMDGNKDVTATFIKTYNITLNVDGPGRLRDKNAVAGARDENASINLDDASPDANLTCKFIGWRDDDTNDYVDSSTFTLTGDRSFTAVFGDREYLYTSSGSHGRLRNDLDGHRARFEEVNLNDAQPTPETGYTLDCWKEYGFLWDGSGTEVALTNGKPMVTIGDSNWFRAHFKVADYKITYNLDGGSASSNPSTYTYFDEAITLNNPTKTGYIFAGWTGTMLSGLTSSVTIPKKSSGDKTYMANWTPISYTVAYDANGGTGSMTPSGYTYDTEQALTASSFAKAGCEFAGWAKSAGGPVVYSNTQAVKNLTATNGATVTLYAKWKVGGITVSGYDDVYDGGSHGVSVTGNLTDATVTYSIDGGTTYSATKPEYTNVTAGETVYVKVDRSGASSFVDSATVKISKATLTVSARTESIIYGQAAPLSFAATYNGFVGADNDGVLTGDPVINCTSYTAGQDAGDYDISVSEGTLWAQNYTFNCVPGTLAVGKKELTITAANKETVYGQGAPAFTVGYSGFITGDDETKLSDTLSFVCSYSKGSPVDNYDITPGGLTSKNYDIKFVKGTLTVKPAPLSVTAEDASVTYGGVKPSFTVRYEGLIEGDDPAAFGGSLTYDCNYLVGSPVGTYEIMPGGQTSNNYTITYHRGTLTVNKALLTVKAANKSVKYGKTAPVNKANYSGFMLGDDKKVLSGAPLMSCTYKTGDPVGKYPITITSGTLSAANYEFQFEDGTLSVNKVTIKVTADNKSVTYWDDAPAYSVTYTGLVLGEKPEDVLTGAPNVACLYAKGDVPKDYPITVKKGSLAAKNYKFTYTPGVLTVNKAVLTVKADDQSVGYGGSAPSAYPVTIMGYVGGQDISVVRGAADVTCTYTAGNDAGSYPINVETNTLDADNYIFDCVDGSLTVTPAPLTVTAKNQTVTFNDAPPGYSVNYSGFVAGDDETKLGGSLTFDSPYATGSAVGTYNIMPGGLTSGNYDISFNPGKLTVDELVLTVKFAGYDGTVFDTQQVVYGNAATAPAAPVREGYDFTGWDKTFDSVTGDMTVTAQYAIKTFTVTFYQQDGVTQIGLPQTVDWGSAAVFETAAAVTGSAFDQWVLTGSDANETDSLTYVKENIKAVASYIRNGYTVTFVGDQGQVIGTDGVLYGESALAPVAPAREGYTFTGWDTAFDNVTGNMTVTAQYAINTYTVRFVNFNGSELSVQTVNWNTAAAAPVNPTRTGFTFTGWDTAFNAVTGDLVVTAQYRRNAVNTAEAVDDNDTQNGGTNTLNDGNQNDGNDQTQNNPQTLTDEQVPGAPDDDTATLNEEDVPMAKSTMFPWWWILVILAAAGIIWFIIYKKRKDRADAE